MLQRIVAIRSVGRFRRCAAVGDVTFRRFTLIFAENGRGKTTLCAILRSLCTNKPGFVIGRTTLDSTERPEVQLLIGNANIAFRNGAWSALYPEIAVFDGTYVSDNVFAGDVVATDQRRNLYRVIIGAQGVTLAARLNELDNHIRHKNEDIRLNRANLQRHVPAGMTADAFIALPADAQIDVRIAAREQELQAVRRAAQIQQRPALAPVAVPVFPAAFAELLAKTFATVSADAEQRVTEHIARHRMQARGESWLTEGLRYVAAEACPFCGQALAGIDLIQAYRSFFSREYHALRDEVTGLSGQVEAAIGDRRSAAIEQAILQNTNGVEFWQQYGDIAPLQPVEAGRANEALTGLRQAAQALLKRKAGTPLDAVAPDEEFTRALGAFEELRTSLGTYNAAVAEANAIITARKQATQAANVHDSEQALERLKAQKTRHTAEVKELCGTDARLQGEKAGLEVEKEEIRGRLDAHTQQVITRYGESIRRRAPSIRC